MEEELATDSILETVRGAVGLSIEDASFDHELLMHINAALATLRQNGVGLAITVKDRTATWTDFEDPKQVDANEMFEQVKLFVFIKTKMMFDPPPPSIVNVMKDNVDELLWRLRESYDRPTKDVNISGI